jgi:hypothetical protein
MVLAVFTFGSMAFVLIDQKKAAEAALALAATAPGLLVGLVATSRVPAADLVPAHRPSAASAETVTAQPATGQPGQQLVGSPRHATPPRCARMQHDDRAGPYSGEQAEPRAARRPRWWWCDGCSRPLAEVPQDRCLGPSPSSGCPTGSRCSCGSAWLRSRDLGNGQRR